MVKSLLSATIDYEENRHLLPEDKNYEAHLYEITLFEKDETIALGQPVYTFIDQNIIFYPIYLVLNNKVSLQIGLYELFADHIVNILDADGDIDIELVGRPLLYGFVNETLTGAATMPATMPATITPRLETAASAKQDQDLYVAKKENHWIQAYMANNNYQMIDNEGKGDCLFAVIRDALAKVGIQKSVAEQRKILADNMTEEIYQGYKTIYQDAADTDAQLVKEIKTLVKRHKELNAKIGTVKDRNAKQAIIAQADELKKRHDVAKAERAYTNSVVEGELRMMKNIHNLTQFRTLIQSCNFWGDTWAISTLERVLNIKIILFSEESYIAGDMDNVLTCGQLNDTVLETKGVFQPEYYILTLYQGYHYQLISYKEQGALTFAQLPYDVKLKVVDKCLERLAGPYYIIPDFRAFMEEVKGLAPTPSPTPLDPLQSDLFGHLVTFQFYGKSVEKPPGKGTGELMSASERTAYIALSRIPDWRRKLDTSWPAPFTLDGRKWQTVEHYYQGAKYKRQHPEFALQFALDSDSALSKDPLLAKEAGEKPGKYLKDQDRPKNIKIDDDFFGAGKRGEKELAAAQYAKFAQNEDLRTMLVATHKAKLQHFKRGAPPVVAYELMHVRQKLLDGKKI